VSMADGIKVVSFCQKSVQGKCCVSKAHINVMQDLFVRIKFGFSLINKVT
jgi:hypothetical protein